MEDVVYLKDGSIVRGVIIEQVPGKTLKIKTRDANVFVYEFSKVEKITKEESPVAHRAGEKKGTRFVFTGLLGGVIYDGFFVGAGFRFGVVPIRGLYLGATLVNHFDELSASYAGGEIGFNSESDQVSVGIYGSVGSVFNGFGSGMYVAPGLSGVVNVNENLGVGMDIKYIYVTDAEDGAGAVYLGVVYSW
jgi:hypothetical protein